MDAVGLRLFCSLVLRCCFASLRPHVPSSFLFAALRLSAHHATKASQVIPQAHVPLLRVLRLPPTLPSPRYAHARAHNLSLYLFSAAHFFHAVDSHMCKEAMTHKIELVKQLGSVLQGTVKPCESWPACFRFPAHDRTFTCVRRSRLSVITQCSIQELYDQEKDHKPAVDLAKSFERRRCNHRQPIPGDECLTSVVGKCHSECPNAGSSALQEL